MADAQRQMHAATTEAATLRRSLTAILTHPDLGPLARPVVEGTPGAGDKGVKEAYDKYKAAPGDEEAFASLLETAGERAEKRVLDRLTNQAVDAENTQRAQQRARAVSKTISDHVTAIAPDVDLETFWDVSRRAQNETPLHVTDHAERIEWQMNRAIEIARERVQRITGRASAAATEASAIQHAAGAVMPAGNAAPGALPAATPEQPLSFAEQAQRNKVRMGPA